MILKPSFNFDLTIDGMVGAFHKKSTSFIDDWVAKMSCDCERFGDLERASLAFSRELAGWLTVQVLSNDRVQATVDSKAQKIRAASSPTIRNSYTRFRTVKLLCGAKIELNVMYCGPRKQARKRGPRRGVGRRGPEGGGLYPQLAALGIQEGTSPALQSEVGWLGCQLPSMKKAAEGLERQGAKLSASSVYTILSMLAQMALSARHQQLEEWRKGQLPVGTVLQGKRIGIGIDGGRTRLREPKKGPRGKRNYPRYHANWREPKLLIIYVLDDSGCIDRAVPALIDATFLGPDHVMELLAYWLHVLGAASAKEVIFLADGADWIWNRVDGVIERAGLNPKRCHSLLDTAHAVSHLNTALESVPSWSKQIRERELTRLKSKLMRGCIDALFNYLERLKSQGDPQTVADQIRYFEERRHLLNYKTFIRRKRPLGSGAVESAIRRVINLRLKGNGIIWKKQMAEGMMVLRGAVLTGRWDQQLERMQSYAKTSRRRAYEWEPTPMCLKERIPT